MNERPDSIARPCAGEGRSIVRNGRRIGYWVRGAGPAIVLLSSLGREASDFNELTDVLSTDHRTIAIDPPGVGHSDLPAGPVSLFDLAEGVAAVIEAEQAGPAILIGHAFGNRLARATATRHPDAVVQLVLIAAGGKYPIPGLAFEALLGCFNTDQPVDEHFACVAYAFFAEGNDVPDHWRRGWHPATARVQGAAVRAIPVEAWWHGGGRPMLVIQGDADRIAPRDESADVLAADFPDRVSVALIERAGHALLPERPDAIATAVLSALPSSS
ncbi:MAG TPA: alpha/beta hydrolase [Sphingomonas sp.]